MGGAGQARGKGQRGRDEKENAFVHEDSDNGKETPDGIQAKTVPLSSNAAPDCRSSETNRPAPIGANPFVTPLPR
jgi:hypothetical protein